MTHEKELQDELEESALEYDEETENDERDPEED